MPLFGSKGNKGTDYKARLEHKLYLAREDPEPLFDLSDCGLKTVPPGIYSLCKVFRKDILYLQENQLSSLSGGGSMHDLELLQILDLHSNCFTKLPDDIKFMKNLRVLNLSANQLITLPEEIGELEKLQKLNVSNNNLKKLPTSVQSLCQLQHLDIRNNKKLKSLPSSLCHIYSLREFLLSADGFVSPPEDVVLQGLEAIMKFLAADCGVDYVSQNDVPDNFFGASSSTCHKDNTFDDKESQMQAKILQLERLKDQRQREMLALEKTNEEHQRKEIDLQTAMKHSRGRLLEDLVQQQTKLENEILRIHQDKEIERQHLVQQLQQVEKAADNVVSQLLALSSSERNPAHLQQLLENEREEEERMLNTCQEEYRLLHKRDILNAMETLLEEECRREEKLREYEEGRSESTRTLLSQEVENDKQLEELLTSHGVAQFALVSRLQKDEELQRAAVAALLERSDARSWGLVQHVSLVEAQLAALTAVEMKRRKLQLDEQIDELCVKRVALSELLVELLSQQAVRRKQLLSTLEEMERRRWLAQEPREDDSDFWLLQYQRLLDSRSGSIMELERSLDPNLAHQLILAGVIHCLPLLANWLTSSNNLSELTDNTLVQAGVSSAETRQAILKAVICYQTDFDRQDSTLSHRIAEPTAPVELGVTECVVCLDQQCEVIYIPCGHMCCCIKCSEQLNECPMCRGRIDQKIRVLLP